MRTPQPSDRRTTSWETPTSRRRIIACASPLVLGSISSRCLPERLGGVPFRRRGGSMRLLIPAALILSLSQPAFAQDWTRFVDPAEGFSANYPGRPTVETTTYA